MGSAPSWEDRKSCTSGSLSILSPTLITWRSGAIKTTTSLTNCKKHLLNYCPRNNRKKLLAKPPAPLGAGGFHIPKKPRQFKFNQSGIDSKPRRFTEVANFPGLWYGGKMKNNPIPLKIKGKAICEDGAKPKPHEYITARALADVGYIVRFVPSNVVMGMADCYINNTIFETKAPEGKTTNCIERNLRKAVDHQSSTWSCWHKWPIAVK